MKRVAKISRYQFFTTVKDLPFVAVTYYSNRYALDKFTFIPALPFRLHSTFFPHYFIALITRRDNRTYESLLLIRDTFIPEENLKLIESSASSGHRYDFNASVNINIVSI